MSRAKLFLVEGIPGAGKTTTARFIQGWLEERGQETAFFQEGDWNHPADFELAACLDAAQYADLRSQFPEQAALLEEQGWIENGEWFIFYRKLQHEFGENLPAGLIDALEKYEIYDLPAEQHTRLLQQRWQSFADRAVKEDRAYVFECCFLQNPVTTLLARHDLSTREIFRHIRELSDLVEPLFPRLIYLVQNDVRASLEKIRAERPKEWARFVTWYLTEQAYGKRQGLSGFEGVVRFYEMRQQVELDYLHLLPIKWVVVPDDVSWAERYQRIETFLSKSYLIGEHEDR